MKEKDPFDFERFKAEAMQGLYEGKSLSPNDGVLAPLMKHLLESMMDGELENHLNEEKASGNSNRRNGKTKKTVRGLNTGTFELETGRDRSGTFEPKVVPKRQLIITEQLEGHVLSMYAKGMSTRAISEFIREMYAMEISATEISRITESVLPILRFELCQSFRPDGAVINLFAFSQSIKCNNYNREKRKSRMNIFIS